MKRSHSAEGKTTQGAINKVLEKMRGDLIVFGIKSIKFRFNHTVGGLVSVNAELTIR